MKKIFSGVLVMGFLAAANGFAAAPNIVLVLADDMAWADVGYNGQKTPRRPQHLQCERCGDLLAARDSKERKDTEMNKAIRVITIEDNPNYQELLQSALELLDGVECVGGFLSYESFRDAAPEPPDSILLDLNLPETSGLDALPEIKKRMPGTEIIMLTQNDDYPNVLKAIQRGASGYIIKGGSMNEIHQAILDVHNGASVIDPRLSRIVLSTIAGAPSETKDNPLSPREVEVLSAMADGLTKKEVADQLNLSYYTIDHYTRNIYDKLKSPNIAASIATAIRKGMI